MFRVGIVFLVACGSGGAPAPAKGSGSSVPVAPADAPYSEVALPQLPEAVAFDPTLAAKGRALFESPTFGHDSCASCHADKPGRFVPALWNVAAYKAFGRDGHAPTLEAITREMVTQFTGAAKAADADVAALVEFEKSLTCRGTAYDRYAAGDRAALDAAQKRGLDVFFGKGGCTTCHAAPYFSTAMAMDVYFNAGIGTDRPDVDGRHEVTHADKDWAALKPPSLRDVRRTGPYMHDGSIATLDEAVAIMARGGIPNKNLNPAMVDRRLTSGELADLVAFLGALDCSPL